MRRLWAWSLGKLKCWAGWHEELMCGGHRTGWALIRAEHDRHCPSAYCPRCGETVGKGPMLIVKPPPRAQLVRRR